MFCEGLNSADTSRQKTRHAVALGLVLLVGVTVAGAALGDVAVTESQSGPIEVSDWTDLDDIRNDTDADYVLVTDLDETTPGYETVAGPNANGGKGFTPIRGFSGSFDGQGNTIDDLTIARPNEGQVGLFGRTSRDAIIEEVTLTNATVTGSNRVGGLVGNNEATVRTSSASGAVTGSGVVGGLVGLNSNGTVNTTSASAAVTGTSEFAFVGGLVGFNRGTVRASSASGGVNGSAVVGGLVGNNEGTVSSSSASGGVNGSSRVGGLVGRNEGTVSSSSASATVTGSGDGSDEVGGLVGNNFDGGTVSNSTASGAVTGTGEFGFVGGLVGANSEGTVSESFAAGAVTGSSNVGGLVGQLGADFLNPGDEAILRDSYYDTQATEQQAAVGTIEQGDGTAEIRGEVTSLTTSQMQGASAAQNMGALDFTNTWRVVTNPPGYPELRGLPDGPDPEPPLTAGFTITPEDPTVGEQLTLNADPSMPESDIQRYEWALGDGTTATGKQITHTYTDSGQFTVELTVQNSTETDTDTRVVSVRPASSGEEATLSLRPAEPTIGLNTESTLDIVITNISDGVSAYTGLELTLADTQLVTFTDATGGLNGGTFGEPTVSVSDDTVTIDAVGYTTDSPTSGEAIARVTVQSGDTEGTARTNLSIERINSSDGETYDSTAEDSTITVATSDGPPAVPGQDTAPTDTDGDGLYEDLDGDGELTLSDVQLYFRELYQNRGSEYVQNNLEFFDTDGDGEITLADVQAVFEKRTDS